MDVSQFGLFDLACRQPRWTGEPISMPEERVVPIGPVRRGVANDNTRHGAGHTRRAAPPARPRAYRSLFRIVLLRNTEHGPA